MADFDRYQEYHQNESEFFPQYNATRKNKPGFAKAIGAVASAVVVTAAIMINAAMYLVCRPVSIGTTSAVLDVNVHNSDGAPVSYAVVQAGTAITPENLDSIVATSPVNILEDDADTISLSGLTANTQYSVVFWTDGEDGSQVLKVYNFTTGSYSGTNTPPPGTPVPPAPHNSPAPSASPSPSPRPSNMPEPTVMPLPAVTPRPVPVAPRVTPAPAPVPAPRPEATTAPATSPQPSAEPSPEVSPEPSTEPSPEPTVEPAAKAELQIPEYVDSAIDDGDTLPTYYFSPLTVSVDYTGDGEIELDTENITVEISDGTDNYTAKIEGFDDAYPYVYLYCNAALKPDAKYEITVNIPYFIDGEPQENPLSASTTFETEPLPEPALSVWFNETPSYSITADGDIVSATLLYGADGDNYTIGNVTATLSGNGKTEQIKDVSVEENKIGLLITTKLTPGTKYEIAVNVPYTFEGETSKMAERSAEFTTASVPTLTLGDILAVKNEDKDTYNVSVPVTVNYNGYDRTIFPETEPVIISLIKADSPDAVIAEKYSSISETFDASFDEVTFKQGGQYRIKVKTSYAIENSWFGILDETSDTFVVSMPPYIETTTAYYYVDEDEKTDTATNAAAYFTAKIAENGSAIDKVSFTVGGTEIAAEYISEKDIYAATGRFTVDATTVPEATCRVVYHSLNEADGVLAEKDNTIRMTQFTNTLQFGNTNLTANYLEGSTTTISSNILAFIECAYPFTVTDFVVQHRIGADGEIGNINIGSLKDKEAEQNEESGVYYTLLEATIEEMGYQPDMQYRFRAECTVIVDGYHSIPFVIYDNEFRRIDPQAYSPNP